MGQVRLVARRGYDFVVKGAWYEARRLQVQVQLGARFSVLALLDTGAYFSFFPQHIWDSQLGQGCWDVLDPEELLWFPGIGALPKRLWPGTPAFEAAVHRGRGIGLSLQDAIRCDFAIVRTRLYDAWGGDSGPVALPSLLGHTDDLPSDRRPRNVLLGFSGILDRARLVLDCAMGTMHLTF